MRAVLAVGAIALLAGCGVYSTKQGRPKEGLETLAVPLFENRSSEPGIEIELTEDIVEGLLSDRVVRITDEESADAIMLATVRRYRVEESFFGGDRTAEQYRLQIAVEIEIVAADGSRSFAGPQTLTETSTYEIAGGEQAELEARQAVVDGIVRKISDLVLEKW